MEDDFCPNCVLVAEPGLSKANVCFATEEHENIGQIGGADDALSGVGGKSVQATQYDYIGHIEQIGMDDDALIGVGGRVSSGVDRDDGIGEGTAAGALGRALGQNVSVGRVFTGVERDDAIGEGAAAGALGRALGQNVSDTYRCAAVVACLPDSFNPNACPRLSICLHVLPLGMTLPVCLIHSILMHAPLSLLCL